MINIGDLLEEISLALSAVPEFAADTKRHTGLVSRITPPCVLIEPRPAIDYSTTYGPAGMDAFGVDITVLVALMGPKSTWAAVAPYLSRSGPQSIPDTVGNYSYTTCSDVTVASAELVVGTYAGTQYLGATFAADAGG